MLQNKKILLKHFLCLAGLFYLQSATVPVHAMHFDRNAPFLLLHKAFGGYGDNGHHEDSDEGEDERTSQDVPRCDCVYSQNLKTELNKCHDQLREEKLRTRRRKSLNRKNEKTNLSSLT